MKLTYLSTYVMLIISNTSLRMLRKNFYPYNNKSPVKQYYWLIVEGSWHDDTKAPSPIGLDGAFDHSRRGQML